MPKYKITSPEGKTMVVSGDVPPTEQEAIEIFESVKGETQPKVEESTLKDPRNITKAEFRERKKLEDEKSFGESAGDFALGVAQGVGQIASMGAGAIGETVEAVSEGEWSKIVKSFPEGVAKALFDMGEIGEAIGGRIGDQFVTDEEAFNRQFARFQQDQIDADKRQAGLIFASEETLPQLSEIASIVGDPTNLIGLGVAGKVAKASKLGKTAQRAGEILDLPNKAVRGAMDKSIRSTAQLADTALTKSAPVLKQASKAGRKIASVAKKPRTVIGKIAEKTLMLKKGGLSGVSTVGQIMSGPAGKILFGTEFVGNRMAKLYKQSKDAQQIARILSSERGRLSFLQEIATNEKISKGIRKVAGLGTTQKGMDIAMNAVSNGVSAGVLQGIFTKMATDDAQAIGQAVGGGLAFGGMTAPMGKRTTTRQAQKGDFTEVPVALDPIERGRDLVAIEKERQANPKNFNKEKGNMILFHNAFDKKSTDAGIGAGKEGTTYSDGAKELYLARGETEGYKYMNDIENAIQDDSINTTTYVRTAATKKQAREQLKSNIEEIVQDLVFMDVQIPKAVKRNKTLTTGRAINIDSLRAIAGERGLDINSLMGELGVLKQHIREGGKFNDRSIQSNSIVQLFNDGEKSLIVQVEPRNIVSMRNKPLNAKTPSVDTPPPAGVPSPKRSSKGMPSL